MSESRLYGWRHLLGAVWAIFLKDMRVFLTYPMNALMRIVEPMMWLTPVYFLSRSFQVGGVNVGLQAYAGTSDYMAFLVLGSAVSAYLSAVFWGMGFSLKNEMNSGVLESNWLTPVPPAVQLVGRSLWSVFLTSLNIVVIGLCVWLLFGFDLAGAVLPALAFLAPLLIAFYGFGFALSGVVLLANEANNVIDIVSNNLTVLCGSNFPVQVLPRPLLALALGLPLTYAYDAVRGLLLGTRTMMPVAQEFMIIVALMLVTVPLGLVVLKRVEAVCKTQGKLGMH